MVERPLIMRWMVLYDGPFELFLVPASACVTRKEGNVLFNDALNTFYLTVMWRRTYGKGPLR